MFYIGNFLIMLAFKTASSPVQNLLVNGASGGITFSLMYALFLFLLGTRLVAKGFRSEHSGTFFGQYIGTFLLLIALFNCFVSISHMTIYSLMRVAAYLIPGILISTYNKIDTEHQKKEHFGYHIEKPFICELQAPIEISEVDQTIIKINQAKRTNTAIQHPIFLEDLMHSEAFLKGIQENDYTINSYILKQINELLDIYLDLQSQYIRTEKTQDLLLKVMNAFGMVSQSLETIYDKSFEDKAFSIESDIKTLELKLRSEGLLGSDFDLKNKEE